LIYSTIMPLHLFEPESPGLSNHHYTPSFLFFSPAQTLLLRFEHLNEILLYLDRDYDLLIMAVSEGGILLLQWFGYPIYQTAASWINPVIAQACPVLEQKREWIPPRL